MFNPLGGLGDLLKNAGKIRESMEKAGETLDRLVVEGSSGGGDVTAKVSGKMKVLAVRIDPKFLNTGDAEMIEELVVAAINQGLSKAQEAAAQQFSSMAGGMPIPGLSNLLGPGSGNS